MTLNSDLIELIKAIYSNPTFQVEIGGIKSNNHNQETGIRQIFSHKHVNTDLCTQAHSDIRREQATETRLERQGHGTRTVCALEI